MDQDGTWHVDRTQPRRHCERWGPSSPSPKGAQPANFSAHVRCGQTAGWTEMRLGMEVGLGPGDFVLDGDPAPHPKKGTAITHVHVHCVQTDEDSAWYGSRPSAQATLC